MALKLTPHVLKQAYDLLSATEPFNGWNLPDGDDVKFVVARGKSCYGWHNGRRGKPHVIAASSGLIGHLNTLLETMGHEMIHLHIYQARINDTSEHGRVFKKFAAQVCKHHPQFDPKRF